MSEHLPYPDCDLRTHPPRTSRDMLGGVYFLARTIDKMRAKIQGTLGPYKIGPGISMYLFEGLGITEAEFEQAVRAASSDAEIVTWILERADPATFDALNTMLVHRGIRDADHRAAVLPAYPVLNEHPELTNWFEIFELDDAWIFDPANAGKTPGVAHAS